jgi:protein-disulfide isomerase
MQSFRRHWVSVSLFALAACGGAPPVAPEAPVTLDVGHGDGTSDGRPPQVAQEGVSEDEGAVPIGRDDPTWGNRNALVTIVELSDFECPFCARAKTTVEELKTHYGPKRLRVVWKHQPLPFHPNARPAAEAAQSVFLLGGSEAFWRFHDAVFENQRALSPVSYDEWARNAGVDAKGLRDPRVQRAAEAKVDKDLELAKSLGNMGTPGFFINGTQLTGAQPLDAFKTVIDAEIVKAQEKLAGGTSPSRVYLTMTAENHSAEPAPSRAEPPQPAPVSKVVYKMPVGAGAALGAKDAPVTIVEFGDFQDPFTARAATTLKKLLASNANDVRLVWRDLPLSYHLRAEPAAELAREARAQKGDAAFWSVMDKVLGAQQALEDSDLEAIAASLGLDVDKVKAAVRTHKYKTQMEADASIADDFATSGTPHFFINGRKVTGAQPVEVLQKVVTEELARARLEQAKGTAPAALYDALIKDGEGPTPPQRKTVTLPSQAAPSKGGANAKVTIIEFSDFQCPFCARAEDALKQVSATYGDRVKLSWRHMPLPMHPQADLAAQASVEAFQQRGATGFWKMHELLYANQATPRGLERDALDRYARTVGLDMVRWATVMDAQTHHTAVEADAKAARDAGISGTPGFLIVVNAKAGAPLDGYFLSGAQPFMKFKKLIDRALAEAK